jgi:hypothetical protein
MLLGDSAFSAAAFSAYPDTRNFIGVTGMQLLASLGRVEVSTAFNINTTIFPVGMVMFTNINGLTSWIDVNSDNNNIWTEVAT